MVREHLDHKAKQQQALLKLLLKHNNLSVKESRYTEKIGSSNLQFGPNTDTIQIIM